VTCSSGKKGISGITRGVCRFAEAGYETLVTWRGCSLLRDNATVDEATVPEFELPRRLINAKEVAARFQMTPRTIYKLARAFKIPHVRLGVSIRFDPDALDKWLRSKPSNTFFGSVTM
jgi:excisionase family DNA binding protein